MSDKSNLLAKVLNFPDLVNYQQDSVVSRVVVKGATGNVTVFAFDKGQFLSEHTAPFDALVCVLDGRAQVTIAGNSHIVESGQIIIMPANQPHALKAVEKFKMALIMIKS